MNKERPVVRYFERRITGYQVKLSAESSKIKRAVALHSAWLSCRTHALEHSSVKQFGVQNALKLMNENHNFNTKTLSLAEKNPRFTNCCIDGIQTIPRKYSFVIALYFCSTVIYLPLVIIRNGMLTQYSNSYIHMIKKINQSVKFSWHFQYWSISCFA